MGFRGLTCTYESPSLPLPRNRFFTTLSQSLHDDFPVTLWYKHLIRRAGIFTFIFLKAVNLVLFKIICYKQPSQHRWFDVTIKAIDNKFSVNAWVIITNSHHPVVATKSALVSTRIFLLRALAVSVQSAASIHARLNNSKQHGSKEVQASKKQAFDTSLIIYRNKFDNLSKSN